MDTFSQNFVIKTRDELYKAMQTFRDDGRKGYDFATKIACDYNSNEPHLINQYLFNEPICPSSRQAECDLIDDIAKDVCHFGHSHTYEDIVEAVHSMSPKTNCSGNLCFSPKDKNCAYLKKACSPGALEANFNNPFKFDPNDYEVCKRAEKHCKLWPE